MKKILLAISFLLFASCTEYTVKVEADDVNINGDKVENGDCVTYKKAFFGWFGDALTVTVGEKETSYEEGHYVVGEEIKEVTEACEEELVVSTDEDDTAEGKEIIIVVKPPAEKTFPEAEAKVKAAQDELKTKTKEETAAKASAVAAEEAVNIATTEGAKKIAQNLATRARDEATAATKAKKEAEAKLKEAENQLEKAKSEASSTTSTE